MITKVIGPLPKYIGEEKRKALKGQGKMLMGLRNKAFNVIQFSHSKQKHPSALHYVGGFWGLFEEPKNFNLRFFGVFFEEDDMDKEDDFLGFFFDEDDES